MIKRLSTNKSGNVEMVNAAIFLIVIITILYIGLQINQNVIDSSSIEDAVSATNTMTYGAVGVANETVNLSTEVYKMVTTHGGVWNVQIGADVTGSADNLTAEINTNSTLFTATNVAGVVTITSVTSGTDGNAYTAVTNVTTGTVGAALFSGGLVADELYTAASDMDTTTESAYSMAGILPIVLIAVAILSSLLLLVTVFR